MIHKNVFSLLGARAIADMENHHNFSWKEIHDGRELIVHRKGATPAGNGVLGVIPGSMAGPTSVIRNKGKAESLMSAWHGAGRKMSRRVAKDKFNLRSMNGTLDARGIRVLSAGAGEVPGAYKNIESVMAANQTWSNRSPASTPKSSKCAATAAVHRIRNLLLLSFFPLPPESGRIAVATQPPLPVISPSHDASTSRKSIRKPR